MLCRSRPAILEAGMAALEGSQSLLPKELRAIKSATPQQVALWEMSEAFAHSLAGIHHAKPATF